MVVKHKKLVFLLVFIFLSSIVVPGTNPVAVRASDFSILDYGATANDETDDTEAVQKAINAAASGDSVRIPDGVYNVSGKITVKSGLRLEGQSQAGAVLKFTGTAPVDCLLRLDDASTVELRNFTIDGNNNDFLHNGIWAANSNHLLLQFLTVRDLSWHEANAFGPHGIGGERVSDSEISDCTFTNMGVQSGGGSAMRIGYNSSRVKILRNTIANTGEGGIRCNDGDMDFIIRNNKVTGSGLVKEGLSIECYRNCKRFLVEDNDVDTFLSIAGCENTAVRRNHISDKTGRHITIGLEAASSYNVYTDNTIDDGHTVGLSASWQETYQYFANNIFQAENMWGLQLQGGDAEHRTQNLYFYNCSFNNQTKGEANPPYPGYEGYGFRINGNSRNIELDSCNFNGNARYGLQFGGQNVNNISLMNCSILNNGEAAFAPGWSGYTGFEAVNCTISGNPDNSTPAPSSFASQRPAAAFTGPDAGATGEPVSFSSTASDPDGSIVQVLWDFGDGIPSVVGNPSHTYYKAGTYTVTLVAWDDTGRAARTAKTIAITGETLPEPFPTADPTPTPTPRPDGSVQVTGTPFGSGPSWNNDPNTTFDKMFDGNTDTFYDCADGSGGYAGMDTGEGNAKKINVIRFVPRTGFADRMPGGKFQGSNTAPDSGYTDLYTVPAEPVAGWNEVTISDAAKYRYLRYLSPVNGYCNIAEVEFYGTDNASVPTPSVTPTPIPTPTASAPFSDNFDDGNAAGWTTYGGSWTVVDNKLHGEGGPGDKIVADGTCFSDLTFQADITAGPTYNAGLIFRVTSPSTGSDSFKGYYLGLDEYPDKLVLARMGNGTYTEITSTLMTITAGTTYHVKVSAQGSSIQVYVDDKLMIDAVDSTWGWGAVGVRAYFTSVDVDNISAIPGEEPTPEPNKPPVLQAIGVQTVTEGRELMFSVTATDPEQDPLTLSAENIPEGAAFDTAAGTFTWMPGYTAAGIYTVTFKVSDGEFTVAETVEINVANVPAQALVSELTGSVNGLDINKQMKALLIKELGDVNPALDKQQYKLALVKLKVFMAEVKLLEPKILSQDEAAGILKQCAEISIGIQADAQGKDKSWVDRKLDQLIAALDKFKDSRNVNDQDYKEMLDTMDELISKMK